MNISESREKPTLFAPQTKHLLERARDLQWLPMVKSPWFIVDLFGTSWKGKYQCTHIPHPSSFSIFKPSHTILRSYSRCNSPFQVSSCFKSLYYNQQSLILCKFFFFVNCIKCSSELLVLMFLWLPIKYRRLERGSYWVFFACQKPFTKFVIILGNLSLTWKLDGMIVSFVWNWNENFWSNRFFFCEILVL